MKIGYGNTPWGLNWGDQWGECRIASLRIVPAIQIGGIKSHTHLSVASVVVQPAVTISAVINEVLP